MPADTPGRSLFRLFVMPVVGLVLAAVIANVAFAAYLATRRSLAAARSQQERVAATLERSGVVLSQPVLETLRQLTGSEFVIWNPTARTAGLSTLPAEALAERPPESLAQAAGGNVSLAGRLYRVGATRSQGVRPETVLVLTPVQSLARTTLEAVWPVLAVALATLAVLVPLGLVTTTRLAARIVAVERHVARIALGRFGERLAAVHASDDIGRLAAGVDHLSGTLADLRTSLVSGERQRLLGQLAAGFAHELRNAVTGARLAIELHGRRCRQAAGDAGDDSLAVARRQLDILEEEVRGLLALGRPDDAAPEAIDAARLLDEVRGLTGPRCDHAGVTLDHDAPAELVVTGRR